MESTFKLPLPMQIGRPSFKLNSPKSHSHIVDNHQPIFCNTTYLFKSSRRKKYLAKEMDER